MNEAMDLLDSDSNPPRKQGDLDNLSLLVDIYKHHWDVFFKGFAFYLAACAVFATLGTSSSGDVSIFQKLFSGTAVAIASGVAFFGLRISFGFLKRIGSDIDELCESRNFRKIYFTASGDILKLLQRTTCVIGAVGIAFVLHTLLYKDQWRSIISADKSIERQTELNKTDSPQIQSRDSQQLSDRSAD